MCVCVCVCVCACVCPRPDVAKLHGKIFEFIYIYI